MKKGMIVNLAHFKLINYVTLNKILILIFIFFISGVVIGSTVLNKNEIFFNSSSDIFKDVIQLHTSGTFFKKLYVCTIRYVVVLVVYFLSGTSMLGIAIIPFAVGWQGALIGNIISYLYSVHGLTGIAFNAVILIPPIAVFTICCFFAAKNSILYSLNIARLTMPKNNPINLNILFKNYCYKYLIFIAVSLICTLLEIILNTLFLKFFNF